MNMIDILQAFHLNLAPNRIVTEAEITEFLRGQKNMLFNEVDGLLNRFSFGPFIRQI